ncbi:MAG: quinohemoprotein amine dehydrogenase subunit alpha [Rudaea sp.]
MAFALAVAAGGAQAFDRESLVFKKCSRCHAPDANGRLARVEQVRTTPEEWAVIVDRMRRLHGMTLRTGEMDRLLKELATTQLLTPQEQAAVSYLSLWHNAQVVEAPADKSEEKFFATCVRCHTAGKIRSYRMTPDAWAKLRDFHLYAIPTVVFQLREMKWVQEADAVLAQLAAKLPYGNAWSPPSAKIAGQWRIFGDQPGRGTFRGEATIASAGDDPSEYTVSGRIVRADGATESLSGEATLYGGYALRTRTKIDGVPGWGAYIVSGDEIEGESHLPAPDFRTSRAHWLRAGSGPKVARIVPAFVLSRETTTLTVEGVDLPEVTAKDVAFDEGAVEVIDAKRVADDVIRLVVRSRAATLAIAKVSIKGIDATAVTLAPRIDGITVTPALGRARLSGGNAYPAEGVQFQAIAYAKSGAGKSAKRVPLGPVPAKFTLAEEKTRPRDDDLHWLGTISPNGTYIPVGDYGPNPKRDYTGENSGLVKVVARYQRGDQMYTGSAQLAVTMPDFIARLR